MLVTDCCGAFPDSQEYAKEFGVGICPECKQRCHYINQVKFDEEHFEECEECYGTGEVEKNFSGWEGDPEYDAPVECFECGGAGMIKKEKHVDIDMIDIRALGTLPPWKIKKTN